MGTNLGATNPGATDTVKNNVVEPAAHALLPPAASPGKPPVGKLWK
jgi:hypothetical protein